MASEIARRTYETTTSDSKLFEESTELTRQEKDATDLLMDGLYATMDPWRTGPGPRPMLAHRRPNSGVARIERRPVAEASAWKDSYDSIRDHRRRPTGDPRQTNYPLNEKYGFDASVPHAC